MLSDSQTNFSSSKYIVSIPGLLKVAAMLLFFASSIVFLLTPVCSATSLWFGKLYPISSAVSGILIALLYAIFAIGIAKRNRRLWTHIDLVFNMLDFTVMLVVSIVTMSQCSNISTTLQMVPAPMGIIGATFLAVSSTVWFIQNRGGSDLAPAQNATNPGPHLYRKSVMV